ncbi:MAG: hypothetical protein HYY84_18220 [Deltaproteobacteria bacterium]|nr:hypothetical protein [Deltaproteobacteria bacterium]
MNRFITVLVDSDDAIPEGCCLRFRAAGESFTVSRIRYSAEADRTAVYRVFARGAGDTREPARACLVDDSGAGVALLITGAQRGLLLVEDTGDATLVEPYLLIDRADVID